MASLLLLAACTKSGSTTAISPWEAEVEKFEQADRLHPPARGAVLFVGSSSIARWTSLESDLPGTRVLNRGLGGSELADTTAFASRLIAPYQPRLIFLYAGDNDIAAGRSPEFVFGEFRNFVTTVRRLLPETRIGFISIKPSPSRTAQMPKSASANALIKGFIDKDPSLFYVDVFSAMLDDRGGPKPELFGSDHLHMNAAGYALWGKIIAPLLR